ncbi:MAG: hypothetical protein JNN09_03930 [Alphaproteobacteria bacterium]|nr:hypothetical protein [Alphaproteobacteria bacterium]
MEKVTVRQATSGAHPHKNEDGLCHFVHTDKCVDLVIIDGASSVADMNYLDDPCGDPTWFVSGLCEQINLLALAERSVEDIIEGAVREVAYKFKQCQNAENMPIYAKPIAAISWVRLSKKRANLTTVDIYALGDCKSLMRSEDNVIDLDPYINQQEVIISKEIQKLKQSHLICADNAAETLMPMLRERREEQNAAFTPSVLCLHPKGKMDFRRYRYEFHSPFQILLMTDGLYRFVDTYGIHSNQSLFRECVEKGLDETISNLRQYEAQRPKHEVLTVKKLDDASAILCSVRED